MSGFPLIGELNAVRHNMFQQYTYINNEIVEKVLYWVGHKAISVCVLPLNLAGVGVGMVGMTAATMLSTFKIAVFTVTLGHIKPSFDTGMVYFLRGTGGALAEIVETVAEVTLDAIELIEMGITTPYRVVKWIAEGLRLTNGLELVIHKITQAIDLVLSLLENGFMRAGRTEINDNYDRSKFPFYIIDKPVKDSEANTVLSNRSWKQILDHTSACMLSIPVNGAIAGASLIAGFICFGALLTKGIFNTVTNSSLPVPTFTEQVMDIYGHSIDRLGIDISGCITDIFISIYKISKDCGVSRVIEILEYIPEAIFERG